VSDNRITLADVQRRQIVWLEPGTVPRGMLTLLAGWPGLGKSMWSLMVAAKRSRLGEHVLLCSAEDALEYTVKPRLQALEADLSRIHALEPQDADGNPRGVTFPADIDLLVTEIRDVSATLVVIDPLDAHYSEKTNSHNSSSLRAALAPLHRAAESTEAAILGVLHLNKSQGNDPMRRLNGSIAGPGAARSALLWERDPDDETDRCRVLAHFKSNVGPLQPSQAYVIESVLLPATDLEPEVSTARVRHAGSSARTASDLLESDDDRTKLDEACEFLAGELTPLPMMAKTIYAAAATAGISKATLHRATKKLRIEKQKSGFGSDGGWQWSLPTASDEMNEEPRNQSAKDSKDAHSFHDSMGGVE
jgi:putative DNA primase/helicase